VSRSQALSIMRIGVLLSIPVVISGFGCIGSPGDSESQASSTARRKFPLDGLPTAVIRVHDHPITVWLAVTPDTREEGLMWVPAEQLPDDRGMLFVFPDEQLLSFWMKNTITPLDIAYARMNGEVVTVHTMPPLTLRTFPSYEPAIFALEMREGTFARLGLKPGTRLDIPPDVFKGVR